jgi:hypothetical protein
MDKKTAISVTDEVISNLTRKNCIEIINDAKYQVDKLISLIRLKYPELSGWYYDNDCTTFCRELIVKHILKESVEMVSAEIF